MPSIWIFICCNSKIDEWLHDYHSPEEEVERKKAYLNHLRELFEAIDVSAEGMISRESLQHAFKHEAIAACQKKDHQAKPRFKSEYGELSTGPACTTPQSASGLVSDESCNNYGETFQWNQLDARQVTANSLFSLIFSRMFGSRCLSGCILQLFGNWCSRCSNTIWLAWLWQVRWNWHRGSSEGSE